MASMYFKTEHRDGFAVITCGKIGDEAAIEFRSEAKAALANAPGAIT